jgi:hypothetical protein
LERIGVSHIHLLARPWDAMNPKRPKEPAVTTAAPTLIEGTFRVVATEDASPARKSPNRQRLVARIVFWNSTLMVALVALPFIF